MEITHIPVIVIPGGIIEDAAVVVVVGDVGDAVVEAEIEVELPGEGQQEAGINSQLEAGDERLAFLKIVDIVDFLL